MSSVSFLPAITSKLVPYSCRAICSTDSLNPLQNSQDLGKQQLLQKSNEKENTDLQHGSGNGNKNLTDIKGAKVNRTWRNMDDTKYVMVKTDVISRF